MRVVVLSLVSLTFKSNKGGLQALPQIVGGGECCAASTVGRGHFLSGVQASDVLCEPY